MKVAVKQGRERRGVGTRYELQHDPEQIPLTIFAEEMYLTRITPTSMEERGRRLRAAFPKLWAEYSLGTPIAAIRRVA